MSSKSKHSPIHKYCLISAANSFTNWHIDFGGTSVFYHVCTGKKWFFLIQPTSINIKLFYEWHALGLHSRIWFPEYVRYRLQNHVQSLAEFTVYVIEMNAMDTAFLPAGWIHCVYTPEDSLAIGGNYYNKHFVFTQCSTYVLELLLDEDVKFKPTMYLECHYLYVKEIAKNESKFSVTISFIKTHDLCICYCLMFVLMPNFVVCSKLCFALTITHRVIQYLY